MERKPRKCKICKAPSLSKSIEPVCGIKCAIELAKRKREKKEAKDSAKSRSELRERKERIKTRGEWLKEAQAACNAFIRKRDSNLACVSCGSVQAKQWDAGHYKTTAARPGLRFHPANIHKQCSRCNDWLSGNIHPYRVELINRVGNKMVDYLENSNPFSAWTIEEIKEIKAHYKELLKYL